MRHLLVLGLAILFVFLAPAASANYCSPQYSSCSPDDDDGGGGGTGTGEGSANIPRNGDVSYGAPYEECTASMYGTASCYECTINPRNNAPQCSRVMHSGRCECTITYSNYIAIRCRGYGACEYVFG